MNNIDKIIEKGNENKKGLVFKKEDENKVYIYYDANITKAKAVVFWYECGEVYIDLYDCMEKNDLEEVYRLATQIQKEYWGDKDEGVILVSAYDKAMLDNTIIDLYKKVFIEDENEGCEYCNGKNGNYYLFSSMGDYRLRINNRALDLTVQGHDKSFWEKNRNDKRVIRFCPMCGRKL